MFKDFHEEIFMKISDIKNSLKKIREKLELGEWCYSDNGHPVEVDIYLDEKKRKVYQVDEKTNRYRVADDGGKYGNWSKES